MSSTSTRTLPIITIDTDVDINNNPLSCPIIPSQPLSNLKLDSTRKKKKGRITARLSRLKSKGNSSSSSSTDEQVESTQPVPPVNQNVPIINRLSRTIPTSFNSQNKLDVLPPFSVDQASIPTLPVDRLSIQMNLEAIPKYHDYPHLFLFKDIACKDESIRSVDKIEDQTWCTEYFKAPIDELLNNESLEPDDIERDQSRFFDDNSNQRNSRKIQNTRKLQLLDKFRNIEYKEIGLIDNVVITDNINPALKNDNDLEIKPFEIKINEESFILGAALIEDKSRFLNSIRFFATEKKRPIRDLLKYGVKEQVADTFSDSEGESTDSEDENEDDLSDVVELIEELSERCSQHEKDFFFWRDEIDQKARLLDLNIRKFHGLDEIAKDLNEKISVTGSRSTKEMEETIDITNRATETIAEKLASIHTRIRDKHEILKQHQQALKMLQNRVELEKRTERVLAKYRKVLGGSFNTLLYDMLSSCKIGS
ncbi:28231_t:CDS:10 [Gigaspora margarita]|uniref:28231_t:CDS:1 n=1 Tax=Gigaspora margarita TaxID=4874 RepID=A0ABN7UVR8_GIGMA|nr:28231_t:CDS:10 [Gigaspora margarita]